MKHQKLFVLMLLMPGILSLLLSSVLLTVSASVSQDTTIEQIEEVLDITVFYQKETDRLIQCFDVNDDGYYAIGYKNNTILIYDSNCVFQYGYRFTTEGTYGIAFKGDNIVIYLGRSGIAVEIDSTGKCVAAEQVYFSKDIADSVMNRTHKQIGNVNYHLERDIGIFNGDYPRLIKTNEDGVKTVLHDVTIRGYLVGSSHFIVLSIFPIAGIAIIA